MLKIPEVRKPSLSFTQVQQQPTEPYMQFVDCLWDALDKQVDNREAKEALLLKLAVENANTDWKKILQTLPINNNLVQMIEACNCVGSIAHQTEALASAFAAALTMNRDTVMVSAGIELIFFTLAGIVLCFEISMEKTCWDNTQMFRLLLGSADTSQGHV